MKWDELDALVRKRLYKDGISDYDIAWIRIEPGSIAVEIILLGFDSKYGIRSKQLDLWEKEK